MAWFTALRRTPVPLLLLMAIALAMPLIAVLVARGPLQAYQQSPALDATVYVLTYFILPILLSWTISVRSPLFLPVFLATEFGVGYQIYVWSHSGAAQDGTAQYILLVLGVAMTLWLMRRDILLPFLVENKRFWRRFRRFNVDVDATLVNSKDGAAISVKVTDVSLNGLRLIVPKSDTGEEFGAWSKEVKVVVDGTRRASVNAKIMRCQAGEGGSFLVGLEMAATKNEATAFLMAVVASDLGRTRLGYLQGFWASTYFKRAALALGMVSLVASYTVPIIKASARNAYDPVAVDDDPAHGQIIHVRSGDSVFIDVVENDVDGITSSGLRLNSVSAPQIGTVVGQGNQILYTSKPVKRNSPKGRHGVVDSFMYTAMDGRGSVSKAAKVSVIVENAAAIAADDVKTCAFGATVDVDVLRNDVYAIDQAAMDQDNYDIGIVLEKNPSLAEARVIGKKIRVTCPLPNKAASDKFQYYLVDKLGNESTVATVTLNFLRQGPPSTLKIVNGEPSQSFGAVTVGDVVGVINLGKLNPHAAEHFYIRLVKQGNGVIEKGSIKIKQMDSNRPNSSKPVSVSRESIENCLNALPQLKTSGDSCLITGTVSADRLSSRERGSDETLTFKLTIDYLTFNPGTSQKEPRSVSLLIQGQLNNLTALNGRD